MKTKVSAGTITRTIILILALINQLLTAFGKPMLLIEDDTVTQLISAAFTIVAAIVAWWKNNSFTDAAIIADGVMQTVKGYDDFEVEIRTIDENMEIKSVEEDKTE